jgi:predicted AAA+ superfamily ATPase
VREYFQILKDTLVADELPAWKATVKRKPLSTSKFYFFDVGVARFLQGRRGIREGSPELGEAFEAYLHHELRADADYTGRHEIRYWRSRSGYAVDFILADKTAIEAKARRNVTGRDLKGLLALREEGRLHRYVVASLEDVPREKDGIAILPWRMFLDRLWDDQYI